MYVTLLCRFIQLDCTVFVTTRTMVRKRLPYRREIFSLLKRTTNNCSTDGILHLKDLPHFARLKQTFHDFMKIGYFCCQRFPICIYFGILIINKIYNVLYVRVVAAILKDLMKLNERTYFI